MIKPSTDMGAKMENKYIIAAVSCGKDSLVIPHECIRKGIKLDEVIFYDTGMEFEAIYQVWNQLVKTLDKYGIKHTVLTPKYNFYWQMLERPVNVGKDTAHFGYSWCGGACRWGTTDKLKIMDQYAEERNANVFVGIAADETYRLNKNAKNYKHYPLIAWGMSESDCLAYCYKQGYEWREYTTETKNESVRLYDILKRVSCWCCTNKNLNELRNIYHYLPKYWEKLKYIQANTSRPMKGKGQSVFDLEKRFKLEDSWLASGKSITTREFYTTLKLRLEQEGL